MSDPASGAAYTKLPNAIIDILPDLGFAELKVVLAIARKTIGWQKECDVISLTQLEKATGLGRRHVIQGLHAAEARGLIEHTPAKRNGRCYRLVTLGNQSDEATSNLGEPELVTLGNQSSPQLVTLGNTQKKESISKESSSSPTPIGGDVEFIKTLIREYRIGPKKAQEIAATGADPETVYQSLRNCVDPKNPHSLGRIILDLVSAPPEPGKPYPGPFGKPTQNGTGPPGYKPPADALSPEERARKVKELTKR